MKALTTIHAKALIGSLALMVASTGWAVTAQPATGSPVKGRSETNLHFEDDVMESLNKPGLDSLDSTRARNNEKDTILYMKRKDLRSETRRLVEEVKVIQ